MLYISTLFREGRGPPGVVKGEYDFNGKNLDIAGEIGHK